ncbi:hemerythrin domain-containing protein [Streptomyces cinereoruber]|uniref:hypothetical protein n=1 Tax=Streptomyces cinereoruber TaxID=67260 RepID=UPI00364A0188
MPKVDLYRNVHMGQRMRLFSLAAELGAADMAQPDAIAEQVHRVLAMTEELREHADTEDTFIHVLLRDRAPEAADALDAEHLRLDAAFAVLDDRARALPGTSAGQLREAQHELYLALNEVISAYLVHLYLEETVAMPALWQKASDDELAGIFSAFQASRTPEQAVTDLQKMLPALPPATRLAIARSVTNAAGEEYAGEMLLKISRTLSASQRSRLYADLGVSEAWALPEA